MEKISVKAARQAAAIGHSVLVQGWIRTRRDSKGGFSFLELNDGSCLANMQVIADGSLPNYETEVKHLAAGCSVTIEGEVKASGGKGQATEVLAKKLTRPRLGRPRSVSAAKEAALVREAPRDGPICGRGPTPSARSPASATASAASIHNFFQEEGFLYIHTPIITASDCEGAGRDVPRHHARPGQAAQAGRPRSTTRSTSSASRRT